MIYYYLKIIVRSFLFDKLYTFIIVFGLAIGLASLLVIGQYIYFEMNFDKHVEDKERIYYTYVNWMSPDKLVDGKSFPAIAPFMKSSMAEVESSVRIVGLGLDAGSSAVLRSEENGDLVFHSQVDDLYMADPNVLEFFSVHMVSGDPSDVLKASNSMVLTKSMAGKFFPGVDPVNKVLSMQVGNGVRIDWRVTGIAEDPLPNATLQFNALCSIETLRQSGWDIDNAWILGEFQTFVKLHPETDYKVVESKINELAQPLRPLEEQLKLKLSIQLFPFDEFHFFRHNNSSTTEGIQFSGDKKLLGYLGSLAMLILVISLANYVNLTTARALKRAKEVGLRKVSGASRRNLITQFLIEFSFMNFVSFLLAFTMAQILFPVFSSTIGSRATWIFWSNPWFWMIAALIFIFCTAASGFYPAFVLSEYSPSKVLKGSFTRSLTGMAVRKALVIAQLSLSVIMIMSIYVISQQLIFMQGKDLGINIEQVMVIRANELDSSIRRDAAFEQFRRSTMDMANVMSASSGVDYPGTKSPRNMVFHLSSDAEKRSMGLMTNQVGEGYFETLGLKLLHGRLFKTGDSPYVNSVVLNETATRELGFETPEKAIGQRLSLSETGATFDIIGVIKDFSLNLKEDASGEIFYNHYFFERTKGQTESPANFFLVKISTNNLGNTMANLEMKWKQLFPQTPFDYFFLDTYFDTFYKEEKQFAGVFAFFSAVGILITCMGLFGLSLYDTSSRTKEIGIRKSLGASVKSIMWLFSKVYMQLIFFSSLVALPVGIFILKEWLNNYPQRITLTADTAIFPLMMMCCIALLTVGYHTYKTAILDPVKSLRAE